MTARLRALGAALLVGHCTACAESSAPPSSPSAAGDQHEIFCGSWDSCHDAAETYCRAHHGTTQYEVVGRVPDRSVMVITCGSR